MAADQYTLRSMVLRLRLPELQELMSFAGKSKYGRLEELQRKALYLVSSINSRAFEIKIRQLHSVRDPLQASISPVRPEMYSTRPGLPINYRAPVFPGTVPTLPNWNPASIAPAVSYFHGPSAPPAVTIPRPTFSPAGTIPHPSAPSAITIPRSTSSSAVTIPCSSKNVPSPSSSGVGSFPQLYAHKSQVRFKQSPFYEVLAELLPPTTIVSSNVSKCQKAKYVFRLTSQQANDITQSRLSEGNKYQTQIHLRCCLVDTSCEQDDNFPISIRVKINKSPCSLPKPVEVAGVGPRRPSRPIDITSLVDLTPGKTPTNSASPFTVVNQLVVTWDANDMAKYALAVQLVQKRTADQLIKEFRSRGIRHQDYTKDTIKAKLKEGRESEISTTNFRVSLLCPLGKRRMEFPCRAFTCTHVQCFDAALYIQLNEVTSTWTCPVCYQPAPFNTLYRDGLFYGILEVAEKGRSEIVFLEDGSWDLNENVNESGGSALNEGSNVVTLDCENNQAAKVIDVIEIDDD